MIPRDRGCRDRISRDNHIKSHCASVATCLVATLRRHASRRCIAPSPLVAPTLFGWLSCCCVASRCHVPRIVSRRYVVMSCCCILLHLAVASRLFIPSRRVSIDWTPPFDVPPFALSVASPSLHARHEEQRFLFLLESFKWLHRWHGHDEARRVADRRSGI